MQLAALALPAHPHALRRVPTPAAVQQQEASRAARHSVVERAMPAAATSSSVVVVRCRFVVTVRPVGQQREMKSPRRDWRGMHLQALDLLGDRRSARSAASARRPSYAVPPARRFAVPGPVAARAPNQEVTSRFKSADGEIASRQHRQHRKPASAHPPTPRSANPDTASTTNTAVSTPIPAR